MNEFDDHEACDCEKCKDREELIKKMAVYMAKNGARSLLIAMGESAAVAAAACGLRFDHAVELFKNGYRHSVSLMNDELENENTSVG